MKEWFLLLIHAWLSTNHGLVDDIGIDSTIAPKTGKLLFFLLFLVPPPSHKVVSSSNVDSFVLAS